MNFKLFYVLTGMIILRGTLTPSKAFAENDNTEVLISNENVEKTYSYKPNILEQKLETGIIGLDEYEESKLMLNKLRKLGILKEENSKVGGRCIVQQ